MISEEKAIIFWASNINMDALCLWKNLFSWKNQKRKKVQYKTKKKNKQTNREKKAQRREKEYHSAVKCAMQTKYTNNLKNEPQDERLPRKFPQGTCLGTRLLHPPDLIIFIWKYVYLNNSGTFKDFKTFSYRKKGKTIFFGLWRWEVTLSAGNLLSHWWTTVLKIKAKFSVCLTMLSRVM